MTKKGFSLVELMVVVAIIAILAAIALPMFSIYRQKSTVMKQIGACNNLKEPMMAWLDECGMDTPLTLDAGTGRLHGTHCEAGIDVTIGSGLPVVRNSTYTLTKSQPSTKLARVVIDWAWTDGCNLCDGRWCMLCNEGTGACNVEVEITDPDGSELASLNKHPDTACP